MRCLRLVGGRCADLGHLDSVLQGASGSEQNMESDTENRVLPGDEAVPFLILLFPWTGSRKKDDICATYLC